MPAPLASAPITTLTYLSFALLLLALFLVPGWLWLRRAGVDPVLAVYAGPGAVALAGAVIVGVGVLLPWSVGTTCVAGLVILILATVLCAVTAPRPRCPPIRELGGVAVLIVAFLSLAAFSGVPSRPYGNWTSDSVGPGRVDSPRWPGLPADNTLPYRTGQVALYKQGGAAIREQFSPGWWLSDRTPLTGLDFAFVAGALDLPVSHRNVEEQPPAAVQMAIEDDVGFWAYQLVAMLLNISLVLGVWLLARTCAGRRTADLAALLTAVMPGVFLNAVYTWPKEAVGYFVLLAAASALRRRPGVAGVCGALAYLTHPAGALWLPALALLVLLLARDGRGPRWRHLARFATPVAVLAAPWIAFTSGVMHATSRWATAPFGVLMIDPRHLGSELSRAWRIFLDNGLLYAVWVRIESTAGSLFPLDLSDTPAKVPNGGLGPQTMTAWSAAHGFSVWGMVGLVLFPFALFAVARNWPQYRIIVLWLVLPALGIVELANGEVYPFANQSMFALVGLLAIPAAQGLIAVGPRVRWAVLAATAFELLSMAYGGLFRPFNIAIGAAVVLTAFALAGQGLLMTWLAGRLDLVAFPDLDRFASGWRAPWRARPDSGARR